MSNTSRKCFKTQDEKFRMVLGLILIFIIISFVSNLYNNTNFEIFIKLKNRQQNTDSAKDEKSPASGAIMINIKIEEKKKKEIIAAENLKRVDVTKSGQHKAGDFEVEIGIIVQRITTENQYSTDKIIENSDFLNKFIPSFCDTASEGYSYKFYLSHGHQDSVFSQPSFVTLFEKEFKTIISRKCSEKIPVSLNFVPGNLHNRTAWVENYSIREAYLDGVDYYFITNDKLIFRTKDWTRTGIATLRNYTPRNLGVAAFQAINTVGNAAEIDHNFVHKTHIDIFGSFYPWILTDSGKHDWIKNVYGPTYFKALNNVSVLQNSDSAKNSRTLLVDSDKMSQRTVNKSKDILNRYTSNLNNNYAAERSGVANVISMSLFGNDPKYLWGAIRNAQLLPVYYPDWKLRVYVLDPFSTEKSPVLQKLSVSLRILRKLEELGVEIISVSPALAGRVPATLWRYFVVDDARVELFMIRDSNSRFSDREASTINGWISRTKDTSESRPSLQCIRDHPCHAQEYVVEGLWAGISRDIRNSLMSTSIYPMIKGYLEYIDLKLDGSNIDSMVNFSKIHNFASAYLWPKLTLASQCYDSVSAERWPDSAQIPAARKDSEYLGLKFDEHDQPVAVLRKDCQ